MVIRILRGEKGDDISREVGVPLSILEEWKLKVIDGMEGLLKVHKGNPFIKFAEKTHFFRRGMRSEKYPFLKKLSMF